MDTHTLYGYDTIKSGKIVLSSLLGPWATISFSWIIISILAVFWVGLTWPGCDVVMTVDNYKYYNCSGNSYIYNNVTTDPLTNYYDIKYDALSENMVLTWKADPAKEYIYDMLHPFPIDNTIYSFTLLESINELYQSGAYALAYLTAAFSGIWPSLKMVVLLTLIHVPFKYDSKLRWFILWFLDQFGKYSFLDMYVTAFMGVVFYADFPLYGKTTIDINPYIKDITICYNYDLQIRLLPRKGFISFVCATTLSLLITGIIKMMHDKKIEKNIKYRESLNKKDITVDTFDSNSFNEAKVTEYSPNNLVNSPSFKANLLSQNTDNNTFNHLNGYYPFICRVKIRNIFDVGLLICLVASMVLCLYFTIKCQIVNVLRFDIDGIASLMPGGVSALYVSLKSVITNLVSCTYNNWGVYLTKIVYYISAYLLPILITALMITFWFVPLSYKIQDFIMKYVFINLIAWSGLEVYWVSCIASGMELNRASQWIIDEQFGNICDKVKNISGEDCFIIDGYLEAGLWYMAIACLLFYVSYGITYKLYTSNIIITPNQSNKYYLFR